MSARTLSLDFSASTASTDIAAAGGAMYGSGGSLIEGVGFTPVRAQRLVIDSYANAANKSPDFYG